MKFLVEIECNNAAFSPLDGQAEDDMSNARIQVGALLCETAERIEGGNEAVVLRDYNGNRVGLAQFVRGDDEVSERMKGTPFYASPHSLEGPCYAIREDGSAQCARSKHEDEWHVSQLGGEVTSAWREG